MPTSLMPEQLKKPKEIDSPFAPAVLTQARDAVAKYQIIVQLEDGEWYGRGLEMPLDFGDGPTAHACVKNTREALIVAVAHLLETGQRVPSPAETGRRLLAHILHRPHPRRR